LTTSTINHNEHICYSNSTKSEKVTKSATSKKPGLRALVNAVAKLRSEQKYCDFVIDCGGDIKFPVHKVIICSRSEYFDKACSGNFSYGSSQPLELAIFSLWLTNESIV